MSSKDLSVLEAGTISSNALDLSMTIEGLLVTCECFGNTF